jgi:glycosyltransferase involved in cell wall biosynthesis
MAQATSAAAHPLALVSVVTPFYNTAPYLAQCIESVLAQTYPHFEYILMDNCSTDGSAEIAESYARRDARIRLIRCSEFLSQLANYNRGLKAISDSSKYCKIVQADDWIFPECLQSMVCTSEQSDSIGLVSSYWIEGDELRPSGFPGLTEMLSGKECFRWYLRTGISIFGTQTQVMYRSSLVRHNEDFYNASFHFADLQKHIEILANWDFGFVHQVLSYSRRGNDDSILQSLMAFEPYQLVPYVIAQRYASVFLEADEAASIIAKRKRAYYRDLAKAALRLKGRAFWQYHKLGLRALSERETHDWPYFMLQTGGVLLWLVSNPGTTMVRVAHYCKRYIQAKNLSKAP